VKGAGCAAALTALLHNFFELPANNQMRFPKTQQAIAFHVHSESAFDFAFTLSTGTIKLRCLRKTVYKFDELV
jgi:hypothetical protein